MMAKKDIKKDKEKFQFLHEFANEQQKLLRILSIAEDLQKYFSDKTKMEIEFAQQWLELLKEEDNKEGGLEE